MNDKEESTSAKVEGSGAIAQDGGVATGEGGLAVGGDVHGPVARAKKGKDDHDSFPATAVTM